MDEVEGVVRPPVAEQPHVAGLPLLHVTVYTHSYHYLPLSGLRTPANSRGQLNKQVVSYS